MTNGQKPEALRLAQALEYCDASVARQASNELRSLYAGNAALRSGYDAARHEIEALRARVQELGQMARDCSDRRVVELQAKVQELESMLAAVGAGGVEPLRKSQVTGVEFSQFLADAMTAAGLVEHGKQCKALATRLGDMVMRLRVEPPPKADHFRDATQMVSPDHLRGATKMTLDEAIERADEVAGCGAQCGVEHAQLADWLRELRDRRVNAASSQPPVAKQPAQAAQGFEKTNAILQSHEITNSDAYFKARPQIDGLDRRNVFRAGFERGWAAAQAPKGGA